jgi:hypothetical protein
MTPSRLHAAVAAGCLAVATAARASDGAPAGFLADLDVTARIWAMAEATSTRSSTPFAPAARLADIGTERGRGEAGLRLHKGGLTADLSVQSTAREDQHLETRGVANELFYELDVEGQHFTIGKRITSWDIGFGFRPLDVIQQEDRRAIHPFTLEGIPQLAWEWVGAETALSVVYANPLRGRAAVGRDEESVALRVYQRVGGLELHLVSRYSKRTELETGMAASYVIGEALEVHASGLWQRRAERLIDPRAGAAGSPLATSDPLSVRVSRDVMSALIGLNASPGWDLNVIAEGWIDPSGSTAAEWTALESLAGRQRDLLGRGAPESAVLGNLGWGLRMYDRPDLLRQNLLLHLSRKFGRFEPTVDLLFTPQDRGWVATGALSWQGEQIRLDAGARLFGGAQEAAYRFFPQSAIYYLALQVFP